MLKKNQVIEALENGGSIMIDTIYRTAHVLNANRDTLGACRYDTAERIERAEGYKTRKTDWYATRFIEKDWDAVSARVAEATTEALRAFERAGVISDLRVEPLSAAECAELSAAAENPAPVRVVYRVIDRSTGAIRFEAASAEDCYKYVESNCCLNSTLIRKKTLREEAAQEAPAAEEAPAQHVRKHYVRADGVYMENDTTYDTTSATEALRWHRAGIDLLVSFPYKKTVFVHGAPQKPERSSEDENRAHCKHIALELDAYVNGEVRRCPDCGEIHRRDWDDVGDVFKCPDCGEVADPDDWETLGVYDFLADVYDIEYRCDSRKEYRSVQIMVACGGPNIFLDTASQDVELYWWSERARYPMSREAVQALDDWAEEYWGCL